MNITGSPDIAVLLVQAVFDLSGPSPVITLTNQSQGPNLGNITYWFVVTSPNGTIIHEGALAAPDAIGAWSNISLTDSWPKPFSQIEWSGAPYNLTVYITDSTGTQHSDGSYNAFICRPNGCTPKSKNYFGTSWTNVQVMCDQASIYFQDQTNQSYKGLVGTRLSASLRMAYPIDDSGSIPAPFSITNFSAATAPISYSSDNYQFQTQIVYQYQLTQQVLVNIRYQTLSPKGMSYQTFGVWCNVDLMPLMCEFQKLVDSLEMGTCADVDNATRKVTLISPKFAMLVMGIMQPLTGIDVPDLIRQIQDIGGFVCDCFNAPTGIIPNAAGSAGGITYTIVPQGGDIQGSVNVVGTNVQIMLHDLSYNFVLAQNIPTSAFTITPATSGYTKSFTFNVNMGQFATDLLTLIPTNPDLVNLWNQIGAGNNTNLQLTVNGGCIFQSSSTFNYAFTLSNIPASGTSALLDSILNGAVSQALNFSFNQTNLPALQTYLNSLGIGNFIVTNAGATVTITSNSNAFKLSELQYSISGTNYIANFTSAAAGYVPISANQVVQNIINYLCNITDEDMVTSQAYTVSYITPTGPQSVTIAAGTPLTTFLLTLTNLLDQTVGNLGAAVTVSCANIQSAFPASAKPITSTDYVLMTKSGGCAQGSLLDVFTYMLTAALTNTATMSAFCAAVERCGAGLSCEPYNFFDVMVTQYDSACAPIVGIVYSLS